MRQECIWKRWKGRYAQRYEVEEFQEKEEIMSDPAEGSNSHHPDRDALGGMDVLKYLGWDVSRSVCMLGPGRPGNYDRRLCDRTHGQVP